MSVQIFIFSKTNRYTRSTFHVRIQKVLSEGVQLFFLVDEGREDQNTTKSGPFSACQQNAI